MKRKRINIKTMDYSAFINYLNKCNIPYQQLETTTILGSSVYRVTPNGRNLRPKAFDKSTGIQLDSSVQLTDIDMGLKHDIKTLIKIIDNKINNMSTKGVYHPRRLQPKWQRLKGDAEKLELFRKYMKAPTSSIGFLRLIEVNLPSKTMESIIIDHPEFENLIGIDDLRQKCIDKFKLYENGKMYLQENGLI